MRRIPLLSKYGAVREYALVDDQDFEQLDKWTWRLAPNDYAVRFDAALGRNVYMHREILGLRLGDPRQVDHVNQARLDNRRSNLRIVTRAEQAQNQRGRRGTSHHRGVCWDRAQGRWIAYATLNRRYHYLGAHDSEDEAARVASEWRAANMPYAVERELAA